MHNHALLGLIVSYDANRSEEFVVHWFVGEKYVTGGFYRISERWYDVERVS